MLTCKSHKYVKSYEIVAVFNIDMACSIQIHVTLKYTTLNDIPDEDIVIYLYLSIRICRVPFLDNHHR